MNTWCLSIVNNMAFEKSWTRVERRGKDKMKKLRQTDELANQFREEQNVQCLLHSFTSKPQDAEARRRIAKAHRFI